jgi:hypothetical protein
MNLYLDDDTADRRLVLHLLNDGHVVVVPTEVHPSRAPDARHFIHAMCQSLVLMTRSHDDFLDLHEVVEVALRQRSDAGYDSSPNRHGHFQPRIR